MEGGSAPTAALDGYRGPWLVAMRHRSKWQRVPETREPDGFYPLRRRVWKDFFYPRVHYWVESFTHRVWRVRVWVYTTHTRVPTGNKYPQK
jgi:hypothetical protein